MHGYTLLLVMICCIFQLDGITTVRHVWLHIVVSNDMLYFSVGWNHDCTTCMATHCCLVMICCIFQLDGITTVRHAWLHIVV
jgi:hypothetical protein